MDIHPILLQATPGEAADVMKSSLGSLYEILVQGGLLMIPIAFCSVIVLAYMIERIVGLRRRRIVPPKLLRGLEEALNGGRVKEAAELCEADGSPMASIALAGIRKAHRSLSESEKAMEDAGLREVSRLQKNIRPLATVAGVAPLLGLLGTVIGMIEAFHVVAGGGLGKQELLASGIAKALVTTGAGLTVAIPALTLYHYFSSRVHNLVLQIDEICHRLLESLEGAGPGVREARRPSVGPVPTPESTDAPALARPSVVGGTES